MHPQTDKILRERGHLFYLVTGKDDTGEAAYYYILVDKHKQAAFLEAFNQPDMELTDYGKVIVSGYGEMPPDDLQEEMKKKYGDAA